MRVESLRWATATIAAAVVCSGCLRSLPFNHYILRAPQLAPGDLGEVRVGGRCEARVEDLKIRVSALDAGSSLLIILNFESDVLAYSFDPMRTTVETANHVKVAPSAYVGPGELDWLRGTFRTCVAFGDQAVPLERRSDTTWHTLPPRDTCFVLKYPVLVVPPAAAELTLEALSKGRTPLSPLRFRLGERVLWSNVIDVQPVAGQ